LQTTTSGGCAGLRTLTIVHLALSFFTKIRGLVKTTEFGMASELREVSTLMDLLLPLALVLVIQFDTRPFELSVSWLLDTTLILTCFVGVIGVLIGELRTFKTLLIFTFERFETDYLLPKDSGVQTVECDVVDQDRREQEVVDIQCTTGNSTIATVELCGQVDSQGGGLVVASQEFLREISSSPLPGRPMEEEANPQCDAQDFPKIANIADEEESGSEDEEKTEAGNMSEDEDDEQPVVAHEILGLSPNCPVAKSLQSRVDKLKAKMDDIDKLLEEL